MFKNNTGLLITISVALFISLIYSLGVFKGIEQKLGYDTTFFLRKNDKPKENIKIIAIDQKSIDLIGAYPWRRNLFSELITKLNKKPAIIAFNTVFSELSEYPGDDYLLSQKIKESGNIVLPITLVTDYQDKQKLNFYYPLKEFSLNSRGLGLTNTFPDQDGIVRQTAVDFSLKNSEEKIRIFSYEVVKAYLNKEIKYPETIYINYQGHEEIFEIYSFYDVYSGMIKADKFKDSIVLVGTLNEGTDLITSPIGNINSVIFQAQLISNLLKNDYIRPMGKIFNVFAIFLISLQVFIFWRYFETLRQVLFLFISVLTTYEIHILLFSFNISFDVVTLIITNITTFIVLILFSQFSIAKSLKSELDRLIANYEKRKMNYRLLSNLIENSEISKENKIEKHTEKITKLAEIGNNLTLERTFLETLLNNIKVSIIVTDSNNNIVLTNPVSEKIFSQSELVGKKLEEVFTPFSEIQSNLKDISGYQGKNPLVYYDEVGSFVYKITFISLQQDDLSKKSNIICLTEDVTDWHQRMNTDGLTGLWNQRHFKNLLEKEINKTQRYSTPLSLIFLDVDHFKSLNDNYGHQTGDIVLKVIAEVMQKSIRNTDIPARYGGEEFAIILPMTDEEGATIFAERLRKEIEDSQINDINDQPIRKVTASLGIAFYHSGTISEFIEAADEALYQGKKNGRNRVTKYSEINEKIV